jgi:hypothetical protein
MTKSRAKKNAAKRSRLNPIVTRQQIVPSLLSISATVLRKNWNSEVQTALGSYCRVIWKNWVVAKGGAIRLINSDHLDQVGHLVCGECNGNHIIVLSASSYQRKLLHNLCQQLRLIHTSSGDQAERVMSISLPENWKWEFGALSPGDQERINAVQQARVDKVLREKERMDLMDLEFQFYGKYRAYGYNNPDEMIDGEPTMFTELERLRDKYGSETDI